jgi:hypothetical protein
MATRARSKRPVARSRRPARTAVERLRAICLALPETSEKVAWGEPTWRVKGKLFAQLDNHHHGADHLAVWLPAPLGEQESLVFLDPQRFFRPPYVGSRGWVGVRIDRGPDWKLVTSLVKQAYREVAPPRLREAVKVTPPRVLERRRD